MSTGQMDTEILIEPNSRTFVGGQTGSGKTAFCMELLRDVKRLVVVDVKGNLTQKMNLVPDSRENWRKFNSGRAIRMGITRWAKARTNLDEDDYYEDVIRKILIGANCMVYFDELQLVTNGAQTMRKNMKELYVAGREPITDKRGNIISGNIGIVASSQRPANIPVFAISESQNIAAFLLMNPDDRDKLSKYMGEAVRKIVPDAHGFYWKQPDLREPVYIPGLELGE